MTHHISSADFLGGRLTLETGKMARQANGAVVLSFGDTVIMATAVCAEDPSDKLGFLPLTVEYKEKTSAVGRFPGGYIKRDGRPTEKEILTARLIDRPVRPLVDKVFNREIQLMVSVFSSDGLLDPDVFAITATSAALYLSDIPFNDPIAGIRVGRINGEFVINPLNSQLADSDMDLVLAGTETAVTMIEGSAKEVSEETVIEAIKLGHEQIRRQIQLQKELRQKAGLPKIAVKPALDLGKISKAISDRIDSQLRAALLTEGKHARHDAVKALFARTSEEILAQAQTEGSVFAGLTAAQLKVVLEDLEHARIRRLIVEENLRLDGRNLTQIRPITCEVGVLPRTHGSALFTRGETQALASLTLGSVADGQRYDTLDGEMLKSFMVHYNFPPFSVGEVKPIRSVGRREIGHGILAERSLKGVLPDDCSYTIKINSDILESNGSSSMASVCAGSLSLLDAGIHIKAPVAGIAMGLITEGDKVCILSDILGSEDHCGDMDFKVAGTAKGITGFQLDLKIKGIDFELMRRAISQAREGRLKILEIMAQTMSAPRETLSAYAPKIATVMIPVDKIGTVIGPGGKMIKKIVAESGAQVNIDDDGKVTIASNDQAAIEMAVKAVRDLTVEPEVGQVYRGKVKSILPFGAFVEVMPGKEGLVHISRLAKNRVNKVEDVVKIGDEVDVLVAEFDEKGRMNLSMKDVPESSINPK